MKARYGEPSIRISITITDREHIFRWGRTRRSHERFSRRKWGPSWLYRRLVDCTTATNGGLPERARIYTSLRGPYPAALKSITRTVPPCTGVHRANLVHQTRAGAQTARAMRFVWRNEIRHAPHRIFGRDNGSAERACFVLGVSLH